METALKIKVGALILVALGLLGGFIAVLGSFSVGPQRTLHLEFADSGSLLRGAPVKIAGVRAGQVRSVDFLVARDARRSEPRKKHEAPVNVRVRIDLDEEMARAVRQDSEFFITTQGVLGEKYVEIVPGTAAAPEWPDGAYIRGNDPPRVDLLFARAESIMTQIDEALGGGGDFKVGELVASLTRLTTNLDDYVRTHRDRLDRIAVNVEQTTEEAKTLLGYLREGVGSSDNVAGIIGDVRTVTRVAAREVGPMLAAVKRALSKAESAVETISGLIDGNREMLTSALSNLPTISEKAKALMTDVAFITAGLTQGRGTVGQLIVDQELYDDLKEMLRDLKRHPWKMLWRE